MGRKDISSATRQAEFGFFNLFKFGKINGKNIIFTPKLMPKIANFRVG